MWNIKNMLHKSNALGRKFRKFHDKLFCKYLNRLYNKCFCIRLYIPIYRLPYTQLRKRLYNLLCKCFDIQFRMYLYTNHYMFLYKLFCIRFCISRRKWNHTQRNNYLCILQSNRYNLKMIVEDNRRMKMKMKMNWNHLNFRYN